jgi:RHS repeat-associated protein
MTDDEEGHAYGYDGESRLVSFDAGAASYEYDGAGQRVKKVVGTGSLGVTTVFVYDAGGVLVAEYGTNTTSSEGGTSYVTLDRLGSTRVITRGEIVQGVEAVKARYDYLPFGEEISDAYGNRSAVTGYTSDDITRQKFTGYERDRETGLDFAQARYYNHRQGRFISADSVGGSAVNPQTLNRYAYTGNNPLNNVDPSGHMFYTAQYNGSEGSGFGYPDHSGELSQELQSEIDRVKAIVKQQQQQQQPSQPPPPLSQQQIDEGMAAAAKHGPMTPQNNKIKVRPSPEKIHCIPEVAEKIKELRKAALTSASQGKGFGRGWEFGFRVDLDDNGNYVIVDDNGQFFSSDGPQHVTIPVTARTVAVFHTHKGQEGPSTGNEPSDEWNSNNAPSKFVNYVVNQSGSITLYNPMNRKIPGKKGPRIVEAAPCP